MFSLCRAIPESSRIRLLADRSSSHDWTPASSPVPDSMALRVIRFSRACKRNTTCGSNRTALSPAQECRVLRTVIDAACVLRLSNPPMPFAGEA